LIRFESPYTLTELRGLAERLRERATENITVANDLDRLADGLQADAATVAAGRHGIAASAAATIATAAHTGTSRPLTPSPAPAAPGTAPAGAAGAEGSDGGGEPPNGYTYSRGPLASPGTGDKPWQS
jgi:hypothetical protein